MNSLSEREYTSAPFSRAPPGLQTRSWDLAHMQLLTLPINPQNPGPVDICHGRNSLVHDATRNAVLVGGRDSAIHIKSGADGDTESSEFIMPGLHVYHHFNPVLDTFPTKALTEGAASEIRVAKWSYARLGLWKLFVLFRLCKYSAHFHDLEQARSTSFSAVLSLERQRIQYLLYSRGALGKLHNLFPPQSLETVSSFVRVKIFTFNIAILVSGLFLT